MVESKRPGLLTLFQCSVRRISINTDVMPKKFLFGDIGHTKRNRSEFRAASAYDLQRSNPLGQCSGHGVNKYLWGQQPPAMGSCKRAHEISFRNRCEEKDAVGHNFGAALDLSLPRKSVNSFLLSDFRFLPIGLEPTVQLSASSCAMRLAIFALPSTSIECAGWGSVDSMLGGNSLGKGVEAR